MKYQERISDPKAQEQKDLVFNVSRAKLQADADLLEVQSQISDQEQELEKAKSAQGNFSLTRIGEYQVKLDDLNSAYKAMQTAYKELFG